ncbi:MAG: hypothetical protein AVDCRST_MAG03-19, partial [uncultured Rubrobacteraceae bacterium]
GTSPSRWVPGPACRVRERVTGAVGPRPDNVRLRDNGARRVL